MAAFIELCRLKYDVYDLYVDHELRHENFSSPFMMGFNGKYSGKGFLLNPFGVINDGLMDLIFVDQKLPMAKFAKFMDMALKQGGIHAYDKAITFYRAKHFKVVNKNVTKKK